MQLACFITSAEGTFQAKQNEVWACMQSLRDSSGMPPGHLPPPHSSSTGVAPHDPIGHLLPHTISHNAHMWPIVLLIPGLAGK